MLFTSLPTFQQECMLGGYRDTNYITGFVLAFTSLNISTKPAHFYEQTVPATLFFFPFATIFKKKKRSKFLSSLPKTLACISTDSPKFPTSNPPYTHKFLFHAFKVSREFVSLAMKKHCCYHQHKIGCVFARRRQ